MQPKGPVVIAIVGPTCTGKTALAIEVSRLLNAEIISSDSQTIYKHMNIGTAKPNQAEQLLVKHHLIDVIEPNRFFSVAEFKELALTAINDMQERGKMPVVCGGTGLYARALLQGIDIPSVPPNPELREFFNEMATTRGNHYIHERLKKVDPVAAERLSVNDRRRIIRALEVSFTAGKAFSQLAVKSMPSFRTIWIGLCFKERALHKQMMVERLKQQFAQGLVEEATSLLAEPEFRPVLGSAVNYKEFLPYIEGKQTLEEVFDQCALHNFQLARKQMTWFRANKEIHWYELDNLEGTKIASDVFDLYKNTSAN